MPNHCQARVARKKNIAESTLLGRSGRCWRGPPRAAGEPGKQLFLLAVPARKISWRRSRLRAGPRGQALRTGPSGLGADRKGGQFPPAGPKGALLRLENGAGSPPFPGAASLSVAGAKGLGDRQQVRGQQRLRLGPDTSGNSAVESFRHAAGKDRHGHGEHGNAGDGAAPGEAGKVPGLDRLVLLNRPDDVSGDSSDDWFSFLD